MFKIPVKTVNMTAFPDHGWRFGRAISAFYITIDDTKAIYETGSSSDENDSSSIETDSSSVENDSSSNENDSTEFDEAVEDNTAQDGTCCTKRCCCII